MCIITNISLQRSARLCFAIKWGEKKTQKDVYKLIKSYKTCHEFFFFGNIIMMRDERNESHRDSHVGSSRIQSLQPRKIVSIPGVSRHVAWGQELSVCGSSVLVWLLQSEWHAPSTTHPLLRVASQSFLNLPLEPPSGPRLRRRRLD